MDRYLLSIRKRVLLPVVALAALAVWFSLSRAWYESYWFGTIHRVQTTDFNMLHHMLPTTLSMQIIEGRDDLVQKTLDSTFGLFGLVVTDPTGQSILYRTAKVYYRQSWQDRATPEALVGEDKLEPPDVLTDPPPYDFAWEHASPRDTYPPKRTGNPAAHRRILGYVHYIRGAAPTFEQDVTTWLGTGFWEVAGSKRGYFYISLSTFAFSLVFILLVWLRQRVLEVKQVELNHIQRELDIRKKALDHLSQELTAQKARKVWLERESDESYRRALSLKQALEKLRDSLSLVNAQTNVISASATTSSRVEVKPKPRLNAQPSSSVLEEIEKLIPALTDNASALKSQANLLHDYCNVLEDRQSEMKRIVEQAYARAQGQPANNFMDMSPR